jgi:hypothetical protein
MTRNRSKHSNGTLLLKEVIYIRFCQNLPQGKNATEDRIQQNTEDKQKSEEKVRSGVFILCGVDIITFTVLSLFVVTKCYSYSKIVLQLTVVPPGEHPINRFN